MASAVASTVDPIAHELPRRTLTTNNGIKVSIEYIQLIGNAATIMPHSLVMFRPGFAGEGRRLARDLHVRIVRPLDGMRTSRLLGAHLVLILGT